MENNFVENFKSEELEERLEFGEWAPDAGTVTYGPYQFDYIGVTYTF